MPIASREGDASASSVASLGGKQTPWGGGDGVVAGRPAAVTSPPTGAQPEVAAPPAAASPTATPPGRMNGGGEGRGRGGGLRPRAKSIRTAAHKHGHRPWGVGRRRGVVGEGGGARSTAGVGASTPTAAVGGGAAVGAESGQRGAG